MILEYILKYHFEDCLNVLAQEDILGYYYIKIDFLKLFERNPDIGDAVLCKPIKTLPACDKDIVKAQQNLLEGKNYAKELQKLSHKSLKRNIHARFFGLPVCPELHRTIFPKNSDLGCFLKVTGTVVRVTQAKMLEYHRKYVCLKCKYENFVEAEFENRYVLKAPSKCSNPDHRCKCTHFTPVDMISREHCKDYQEIKIQEQINKLSIGTIPGSMWVVLEDDQVDCCKPGDDVFICGTVRRRWRPSAHNRRSEVELVLQANHVEVCNARSSHIVAASPDITTCFNEFWDLYSSCPLKGRDKILASICPQVYGLYLVKLALLLTVITGYNHSDDTDSNNKKSSDHSGTNVRGQCHLLLVGDPGTGKSQLLRAGAELTPRSILTSGAGSTRAGLTCAALREEGEWQLEAGALVLSDGGVCCVDEIGQLRPHDRAAVHEAMEQQTVSVAKAGIICKLNTRCAVIAACNPRGHYIPDEPLSANVALGTPLLSRFDLIFILLDSKNSSWDKLVSSYILFGDNDKRSTKLWTIEKIQMYLSLVGPKSAKMTKSANIILQTYYMAQRQSQNRDPSRTTVRMLDSLIRLSQAHCHLMYRNTILPMDAIIAVCLVDLSMQDCALKDTTDALHSIFPKHPDYEYLITAKKLLTRLNLYSIWNEELIYYAKLLNTDHKTLENEINQESDYIFSKFDVLSDDNVPLTSTLITSSYFNNKKPKGQGINDDKENVDEKKAMNDRLAATLKKHATLNKEDVQPSTSKAKPVKKRKRKEVTVDSAEITTKLKRNNSNKSKPKLNRQAESDSEESLPNHDLLNAVPSVNDIFGDLDIQVSFESPDKEDLNDDKRLKIINTVKKSKSESITNTKSSSSTTKDKLNGFKFSDKHDLNKLFNKKINKVTSKTEENNVSEIKSNIRSSSQISIFETEDCDIDLDI